MGSIGLSNVQQYPPQHESNVHQTRDLCFDTTRWESWLPLNQNSHVLVNDHITRYKDPQEVVIPCHETHMEHWFIQCPTKKRILALAHHHEVPCHHFQVMACTRIISRVTCVIVSHHIICGCNCVISQNEKMYIRWRQRVPHGIWRVTIEFYSHINSQRSCKN